MKTEIGIEFHAPLVPSADIGAAEYSGEIEAEATKLGWPEPHSAGRHVGKSLIDLHWTVDGDPSDVEDVISVLRDKFNVYSMAIAPLPEAQQVL
jgi:hypothetical protein